MCLIIVAPKGSDKKSNKLFDYITYSSTINKDGMGFAFKRANSTKVFMSKGYTDVNAVINLIEKFDLKENDELVFHARIGNKGEVSNENCHPFIIDNTDEYKDFLKGYTNKPVLFHNGTFLEYSVPNSKESDTYLFSKEFLSNIHIQNILREDPKNFEKMFKKKLDDSRICVINPVKGEGIVRVGSYYQEDGYLFSKYNYKSYSSYKEKYDYGNAYGYDSWDDSYSDNCCETKINYYLTIKNNIEFLKRYYRDMEENSWDLTKNTYAFFNGGLIFTDIPINIQPEYFFRFQINPLTYSMLDFKKMGGSNRDPFVMIDYGDPEINGKSNHILALKGEEDNILHWEYVTNEDLFYTYDWAPNTGSAVVLREYIKVITSVIPSNNMLNNLLYAHNNTKTSYHKIRHTSIPDAHHKAILLAIYTVIEHLYEKKDVLKTFNRLAH